MIGELVSVLAVFVGGCALLRVAGVTGWALPPLGLLAGTFLQVGVGLVQVVARLPTTPVLTLAITFAGPVTWWAVALVRRRDVAVPPLAAAHVLTTLALLVGALRFAHVVHWHVDSFRYLTVGTLLANGSYDSVVSSNLLTTRLLATGIIHAPANLADDYYLRSVTPLLAASTVAALVWVFREGVGSRLNPPAAVAFAALGAVLLLSINRFVFHAFYINGHLFFGVTVLVIAGCGWLLGRGHPLARALMTLQLVAIPALVVIRPEGAIFAGLAVLPTLLSARVSLRYRLVTTAVLGVSITAWHSYVILKHLGWGSDVPYSAIAEVGLGVLAFALIPLLRWRFAARHGAAVLWLVEVGLWLALLVFAVSDFALLRRSVYATIQNVAFGGGSWGLSLMILAALVAAALLLQAPDQQCLRFVVTCFVPVVFLLIYLREGGYRVGNGDSLNRMLIQIVPLAVLYVVVALATGTWRFARRVPSEADRPETDLDLAKPDDQGSLSELRTS